jgi:hypothetical protein
LALSDGIVDRRSQSSAKIDASSSPDPHDATLVGWQVALVLLTTGD